MYHHLKKCPKNVISKDSVPEQTSNDCIIEKNVRNLNNNAKKYYFINNDPNGIHFIGHFLIMRFQYVIIYSKFINENYEETKA